MSCGPPPCPSPQAERGLPGASRVQFTMAFPASLSASVPIPAAKERQPAGGGPAGCDTGSGGGDRYRTRTPGTKARAAPDECNLAAVFHKNQYRFLLVYISFSHGHGSTAAPPRRPGPRLFSPRQGSRGKVAPEPSRPACGEMGACPAWRSCILSRSFPFSLPPGCGGTLFRACRARAGARQRRRGSRA